MKVVGGFTLEAGVATILTLDFDADKSVVVTGSKNVLIKPVIKLLVRDRGETLAEANQVGQTEEQVLPTATPVPTAIPVPTATPVPTPTKTAPQPDGPFADLTAEQLECLEEGLDYQAFQEIITLARVPNAEEAPTLMSCGVPGPLPPPDTGSESQPPMPPPPDSGSVPPATSTTTDLLVSGFVPAVGQGDPPPGTSGSGPWATRIMLASSTDGLTFTRTSEIVADQGGVPNMIVDHDGRVRVYYVAWQQTGNVGGSDGNFTAVAIRTAPGEWVYHRVGVEGVPVTQSPVDPSVVLLSGGIYRLFYMADTGGMDLRIFSATSTNGVDFVLDDGERFSASGQVFDPAVLEIDSGWRMWIGPDGSYTASSVDGLAFTPTGAFTVQGQSFHPWSAVAVPGGGYRLYGSLLGPGSSGGISSAFSLTGDTWQLDPGSRLTATGADPALEAGFGPDNGVAILADGSYLIAYLATIP